MGTYTYNGKEKIVCACEDFTDENNMLYEFENLSLSTNPDKKIDTEINDIMDVLEENKTMIDISSVKEKFWDMFVVDSLIGNTDRHNGNWGFLINTESECAIFSPIFDCSSCLNPILEDDEIEKFTENEIKKLAVNCYSCLKETGKKINYMSFIKSMNNKDCSDAIVRVFNNINIKRIEEFIDDIECMSNVRKEFYKKVLNIGYKIIEDVYNKIS